MRGKVYPNGKRGFHVYFKGDWFSRDEFGRPLRAEFQAYAFLEHLNALYDPDPAKNRYDPGKFKNQLPYLFDQAFQLYLERKQTDSGWHKAKKWVWEKYFKPYFANQDFRTIDDTQLEAFVKWLEDKGLAGKTIFNYMTILRGFLNHKAFRRSMNITPEFPSIKYQQSRPKKFTDQELDQVFEFIKDQDKPYFLFIRYYGVRPEEASGLLRSAIDWNTREIIISTVYINGKVKPKTKTMKERGLPIIPETEKFLRGNQDNDVAASGCVIGQRLSSLPNKTGSNQLVGGRGQVGKMAYLDSLFFFHVEGKPYSRHMREGGWRKAMKQAHEKYGTRLMTLRDLRSSATSRWLKKGMLIQDAAELLGNSPEIIRKHYSDQVENKVVEIMGGKVK